MASNFWIFWTFQQSLAGLCSLYAVTLFVVYLQALKKEKKELKAKQQRQNRRRGSSVQYGARSARGIEALRLWLWNDFPGYVLQYLAPSSAALSVNAVVCLFLWMVVGSMEPMKSFTSCTKLLRFGTSYYCAVKCLLYTTYIARVHVVYKDTKYEYSRRFVFALYAIVLVNYVGMLAVTLSTVRGEYRPTGSALNGDRVSKDSDRMMEICKLLYRNRNINVVLLHCAVDAFYCVSFLCLFLVPLRKLLKEKKAMDELADMEERKEEEEDGDDDVVSSASNQERELSLLPLKFTLATVSNMAVVTVALILIVMEDSIFVLMAVDFAVTETCIIAVHKRFTLYFWRFWLPFIRLLDSDVAYNVMLVIQYYLHQQQQERVSS